MCSSETRTPVIPASKVGIQGSWKCIMLGNKLGKHLNSRSTQDAAASYISAER